MSIKSHISWMFFIIKYPIWLIYRTYMFITDPFAIMSRVKSYVVRKVVVTSSSFVYEFMKDRNMFSKMGWGILWSAYVCIVLVVFMVLAFLMSSSLVNHLVEKPLMIKENLNLDYGHKTPLAYVPLTKAEDQRVIPRNHKFQATVSLKLPESDYNKNLGIFLVKVELLAGDGTIISSLRRPCMLQFKSGVIRNLLTFLNVARLITGYASESQVISIRFRGFNESSRPAVYLRVVIEQRAEFEPGAGIPEIYSASLALESDRSLLKRVMWYWRKIISVWLSISLFIVELFFTLLCCRPLVLPRIKLRQNPASRNAVNVNANQGVDG